MVMGLGLPLWADDNKPVALLDKRLILGSFDVWVYPSRAVLLLFRPPVIAPVPSHYPPVRPFCFGRMGLVGSAWPSFRKHRDHKVVVESGASESPSSRSGQRYGFGVKQSSLSHKQGKGGEE